MTYTNLEARQELNDVLASVVDEIGVALASLGEAYEQLDEQSGDRLEAELFRPVQVAYGRAKSTHAEFARRYGLAEREFEQATPGAPSAGAKGFVESAVEAVAGAEQTLATLQDSMLPVDVGDQQLRAGLTEVRELLGGVRGAARDLVRTIGR